MIAINQIDGRSVRLVERQERRWVHQLNDAEYIRRCREIDRLQGVEWEQSK